MHTSRRKFIAASLTATATLAVRTPAPAAQFNFKCGSQLAYDHPSVIRAGQMWATIEQESGGRIHTQMFPNAQLGGDPAMLGQLRLGALQFLVMSPGNVGTIIPVTDIGFLGFAFKDEDDGLRVMDGPVGTYIRQEAAAKGMYAMRTFWNSGMNEIASNIRPIRTPADLRGFKIRVLASRITLDLFKELGANAVPLDFPEVYSALQTKVIDGQMSPLVTMESARFYEVEKYISLTNHQWAGLWMVANGEVWKGLPPDLQEIVERNNTRYAMLERRDTKAGNASLAVKLAGQGMTINEVDQQPFRARLRTYYQTWSSTFGPTAWGLLESSLGRRLA